VKRLQPIVKRLTPRQVYRRDRKRERRERRKAGVVAAKLAASLEPPKASGDEPDYFGAADEQPYTRARYPWLE
jgi:hypothetical protein